MPEGLGYYETTYKMLLDDEKEDQVYAVEKGRITYRNDHQIQTLLDQLELRRNAAVLDFGCAKASLAARLLAMRPDLDMYLFDVSPIYQEHWHRFTPASHQAIKNLPDEWVSRFDVITSFFVLEHVEDPLHSVRGIVSLLAPGGVFYGVVPNTFGNVADFIVADHVNHFTTASLTRLLQDGGLSDIVIDRDVHRGALVFNARRACGVSSRSPTTMPAVDISGIASDARGLAVYWREMAQRIERLAKSLAGKKIVIYGSGFYGSLILLALRDTAQIDCVLDASPFRQGRQLFGVPIRAPQDLRLGMVDIVVGLNPQIARQVIADCPSLSRDDVSIHFLADD